MKIEIGQYMIRDWEPGDAAAVAKYADNPKIAANLRDRFPSPYTLADAETFLDIVTANSGDGNVISCFPVRL